MGLDNNIMVISNTLWSHSQLLEPSDDPLPSPSDVDRKDTHKKVLMQLQSIFGHLMEGKLQFHIPKGFWRDFRWAHRGNNHT